MSRSPFSRLRPCIPARSSSSVVAKFYPFQIVHPNGWTVRKVRGTSPLGHAEVGRVVDGGFGPQRLAELVVLLDLGVLVIDVQARDHAVGDDAGAEPARGGPLSLADDLAVEDQ